MKKDDTNTENSNKILISKLDEIITALHSKYATPPLGLEVTLWNNAEVAKYIGVTYKYANEYIVTHHTFPNAIRLPTKNNGLGHARWYAQEVIEWVSKNRRR